MVCIALVWGWLVGWVWHAPRTVREGIWVVGLTLAACASLGLTTNGWRTAGLGMLLVAFAGVSVGSWLTAKGIRQLVQSRTLATMVNGRSG